MSTKVVKPRSTKTKLEKVKEEIIEPVCITPQPVIVDEVPATPLLAPLDSEFQSFFDSIHNECGKFNLLIDLEKKCDEEYNKILDELIQQGIDKKLFNNKNKRSANSFMSKLKSKIESIINLKTNEQ